MIQKKSSAKMELKKTSKKLIVIGGPTAVGKTELAIQLAQKLHTEILNADSRQFYQEMNIGTAKPSLDELAKAPHHFIGHLSITANYTAADYEKEALKKLEALFEVHDTLILCGGSGLFIEAVIKGFDPLPAANSELRIKLNEQLEKEGLESLVLDLKAKQSSLPPALDLQNPRRVIRALEIALLGNLKPAKKAERFFETELFYLSMDRAVLYDRINRRVDKMMELGLLQEVESLIDYQELNALQTVGYKELFSYLNHKMTLEEAILLIKQHTRNYAKRQLTWFRNKDSYQELPSAENPLETILRSL